MLNKLPLLFALTLASCTSVDEIAFSGFSKHLTRSSDNFNPGIELRKGKHGLGCYDSSRFKKSLACSYSYKMPIRNNFYAKTGVVYYDGVSGYKSFTRPIIYAGYSWKLNSKLGIDLSVAPKDLIFTQFSYKLRSYYD